jgi:hypothetical protein
MENAGRKAFIMNNDATKPSLWKRFSTWLKSTEEKLRDGPIGPLARWNEKHRMLIAVTFLIVLGIFIYVFYFQSHPQQNIHHP